MSAPLTKVVVAGRDAALWLTAAVIQRALGPSGVRVQAVELPTALGPADVHATLPPLEALHNQLGLDEGQLLRATRGSFSIGQNFVDAGGDTPPFLHAYGSAGTSIDGRDFFAYWLKARRFGLGVPLDDFSLTASAARQGRLLIPDSESERYGRSDYGYHLPARAYVAGLKALAIGQGVGAHLALDVHPLMDPESGDIASLTLDGDRTVEGELFIDATGPQGALIGGTTESWEGHFAVDRVIAAAGWRLGSIPVYAEIRASRNGWTGLYPGQARTHVLHAYFSALCGDEEALEAAVSASGLALSEAVVRPMRAQRRKAAWRGNCVAIGEAAAAFDAVHGVDLHAVQLGLVHLLACFPAGRGYAAQRAEYNRVTRSAFEAVRDFQSAYYALNRYRGAFWVRARQAPISPALAHRIAVFRARGEIAPWEDDSFAPDSWRALFLGYGVLPESYQPAVDTTPPEEMKAQFRHMLGYVKEQVLRQPTHDQCLARISGSPSG